MSEEADEGVAASGADVATVAPTTDSDVYLNGKGEADGSTCEQQYEQPKDTTSGDVHGPGKQQQDNVITADDQMDTIEEAKTDVDGDKDNVVVDVEDAAEQRSHRRRSDGDKTPSVKVTVPAFGFLRRLFQKRRKKKEGVDADDKIRDPEAGAELIEKQNNCHGDTGRNGVIESDTRKDGEKSSLAADGDNITAEKERGTVKGHLGLPKERWVVIGVVVVMLLIVFVAVVGILIGNTFAGPSEGPHGEYIVTTTTCGPVQGMVQDGAYVFLGIPYAVPPINERRWKPSELVSRVSDCWPETYAAHNHSKLCYQKPLPQPYGDLEFSEDCLYLDIYTPTVTGEDPLAVVVYFAGDSFLGHDVMDFKWRPSARLAKEKRVVFVVVYYRTNAFGFLALDLLTRNVQPPTSGNYGLHDMLTALNWVRFNIEGFGGSPTRVTVFGHGSGATGILALVTSTVARNYFTQAWITGGSAHFVNKTLETVARNNEAFNRHLICDTTECLYSKTPEQILAAIPTSEWPFWGLPTHMQLPRRDDHTAAIVVVDGHIVHDDPVSFKDDTDLMEGGGFMDVPLVIGSSLDAVGSAMMDDEFENFGWEEFNRTVRSHLNTFSQKLAAEAIELYYDLNSTAVKQFVRMVSDIRVTCPLLELGYRASKAFTNNVYFYAMSHVPDSIVDHMNLSQQLAVHGLDVAAIFGCLDQVLANPSERDLRFQKTMQGLFYHFVEHGRLMLSSNPKLPWNLNWVGEEVESTMDPPYPNYDFWTRNGICPTWGRFN